MSKKTSSKSRARRESSGFATRSVLAPFTPLRSGQDLSVLEDRRLIHPGPRHPRTPRQLARITMRPPAESLRPRGRKSTALHKPETIAFVLPRSTLVCVRRAIRKQVLHAAGVAGKKVRRPRRNALSSISCKRK